MNYIGNIYEIGYMGIQTVRITVLQYYVFIVYFVFMVKLLPCYGNVRGSLKC